MNGKRLFSVWMAMVLALCLLMGSFIFPAAAEEEAAVEAAEEAVEEAVKEIAEEAAEEQEGTSNLILMVIENLKTIDWKELPAELKDRIDEMGWKDLQEKLKNLDWNGALESIKSFFTDTEWGEVGGKIEALFNQLVQKGADGLSSLEEYMKNIDLDAFVNTLQTAAEQAASQAQEWAGQAGEAIGGALDSMEETVENAVNSLLDLINGL